MRVKYRYSNFPKTWEKFTKFMMVLNCKMLEYSVLSLKNGITSLLASVNCHTIVTVG